MAIDRTSSSDDDNDELGVLDDLSTSTTAIDLGTTAQVSVVLPVGYQDDDRDDDGDVTADELDPAGHGDDELDDAPVEVAEADSHVDDEEDDAAAASDDFDDETGDEATADEIDEPADDIDAETTAEALAREDAADAVAAVIDDEDEEPARHDTEDVDDVSELSVDDEPTDDEPAEHEPAEHEPADDDPAEDIATDADDGADAGEPGLADSNEPADAPEPEVSSDEQAAAQPDAAQEDIIVREPDPKAAALSHDAANRVEKVARVGRESFVRQPRVEVDGRRDPESSDVLTDDRLLDTGAIRKPEPEDPWRRIVYAATRGVINLGDGKKTRARKELMRRIAAPIPGRVRFVPVLSRKGGVGKTTVTALLGMALADARDDRVVAIDANPDRGTLAERISKPSGKTVRDLVRGHAGITGYADMTAHVTRDTTRLDVLASDADPHVADAFSDQNYRDVAEIAQHYYSLVLTDTGTGIIHSVMDATLDLGDQIVIVSGISVDEARLAAETLTWLETNGHDELARNAVVVINQDRPGTPLVRLDELESHFRSRVRDVVRIPYDAGIATGSAISFHDLDRATRDAARRLAAAVVEGIRAS